MVGETGRPERASSAAEISGPLTVRKSAYFGFVEAQEREEREHHEWLERRRQATAPFVAEWIAAADERMGLRAPRRGGIYFVEAVGTGLIKIGRSNNIAERLHSLRLMSAVTLRLLRWENGAAAREKRLHHKWRAYRDHGEWFIVSIRLSCEMGAQTSVSIARAYERLAENGEPFGIWGPDPLFFGLRRRRAA